MTGNKWLDKHEDDGKIERDLAVIDSIVDESKRHEHRFIGMPVDYEVTVVTSDITGIILNMFILNLFALYYMFSLWKSRSRDGCKR